MMVRGNALNSFSTSGLPAGLLAHGFLMSDNSNISKQGAQAKPGQKAALFKPEELDLYCNKVTAEAFIFHGKVIDYDQIDHFEYDHRTYTVDVVFTNGAVMDLGVRVEWIVRPYFSRAREVTIAQTQDGKSVRGVALPLVHKGQNAKEKK